MCKRFCIRLLLLSVVAQSMIVVTSLRVPEVDAARVIEGPPFTKLAVGGSHTCGLSTGNQVFCWGNNEYGQLGASDTTARRTPAVLSGGIAFRDITAGLNHTCGLDSSGRAYCWGRNNYRQLGSGQSTSQVQVPTLVQTSLLFKSIDAGDNHTCGIGVDDFAYCWGTNESSQIGNGGGGDWGERADLPVKEGRGLTFSAISAGASHTCGISSQGSQCWGENTYSESSGSFVNRGLSLSTQVSNSFLSLSAGRNVSCGINTASTAFCWGRAEYGALGIGTNTGELTSLARAIRTPVAGYVFSQVSVGNYFACGLTASRNLLCWGYIPVGAGRYSYFPNPTLLAGTTQFTQIDSGSGDHFCALAVNQEAFCWGNNNAGQLGDNSTTVSRFPEAGAIPSVTTTTTTTTTTAPTTATSTIPAGGGQSVKPNKPGSPCGVPGQRRKFGRRTVVCVRQNGELRWAYR